MSTGEQRRATAWILLIGDELLNGRQRDQNGPLLLDLLRRQGVRTRCVLILPDEVSTIASAVRDALAAADHVFTSGGIGPTHDDRTMEALAIALDQPLVEHPRLLELFAARFGERLSDAHRRMARIPRDAELVEGGRFFFPLMRLGKLFVLPGVPQLFRDKVAQLPALLPGTPAAYSSLVVPGGETAIAPVLAALEEETPGLLVGSYPSFDKHGAEVRLTLEADDAAMVEEARFSLVQRLAALGIQPKE